MLGNLKEMGQEGAAAISRAFDLICTKMDEKNWSSTAVQTSVKVR